MSTSTSKTPNRIESVRAVQSRAARRPRPQRVSEPARKALHAHRVPTPEEEMLDRIMSMEAEDTLAITRRY